MTLTVPPQTLEKVARLQRLANLLDRAVGIPGTRIGIGLDGLVGLLPGLGDAAMMIASLWIVHRAYKLGVSKRTVMRMLFNICIDALLGSVPVLGDIFDIVWKANLRNMILVKRALGIAPD